MWLEIIYLICWYKKDLALNNLQWLVCHKNKPNYFGKIYVLLIQQILKLKSNLTTLYLKMLSTV